MPFLLGPVPNFNNVVESLMIKLRLASLALLAFAHAPAFAATFVINTTDDLTDANIGDGVCETINANCSLRAAVQEANAFSGTDSLTVPAGTYNLSLSGVGEDAAATGDLDITDDLTVNGAGANQVFIDGMAADRIFNIAQAKTVILNGITIRNGLADGISLNNTTNTGGFGGGIRSEGFLTINDCNIDRNKAFAGGAGIYAFYRGFPLSGSLTVNRTNFTFSVINGDPSEGGAGGFGGHIYAEGIPISINNSVLKNSRSNVFTGMLAGGGIYYNDSTFPPQESFVTNSTISNNRVMSHGGGIHVAMGVMTIENSTISGNTAFDYGGGISIDRTASVNIINSTIAYNSAAVDGGIYDENTSQNVTFTDSIVSNNIGGNCSTLSSALLTSGSNIDNDGSCGFDISNQDPLLQPLADNGGPGFSHALGDGSPALNSAGICLTTDQRSYLRPASSCDLGAVEMEASAPAAPVSTPTENNQISSVNNPDNEAPVAFNLPAAVTAGGILHGIMNAYDPDGDPLTYEITQQANQGNAGLAVPGSNNDIPGGYTYAPLATATGSDSFKYRVCDPDLACSEERFINITITSGTVSSEMNVELTPNIGNVNDLLIVSEPELAAIAPDTDYSYPVGAYFFSVDDIPTAASQSVVTIQLPAEAIIPDNAEVRKLDNSGVWQTLSNMASANVSSAVIDTNAKTITLTLIDNDVFDLNSATGIINDPVALGVVRTPAVGACAPGSWHNGSECIQASPGYYAEAGTSGQTLCAAGSYSSSAGATTCTLASPGYFVANTGSTEQTACPIGYFSDTEAVTDCTAAPIGSYVDAITATSTQSCPSGTTTASTASTSVDACITVPDNVSATSDEGSTTSGSATTTNNGAGAFSVWLLIALLGNALMRRK